MILIEPDIDVSGQIGEALLVSEPRWLIDIMAPLVRGASVDAGGVLVESTTAAQLFNDAKTATRSATLLALLYESDVLVALDDNARLPNSLSSTASQSASSLGRRAVLATRMPREPPSLALRWAAGVVSGANAVEQRRLFVLQFVPSTLIARLLACVACALHVDVAWQTGALVFARQSSARALIQLDVRRRTVALVARGRTSTSSASLVELLTQTLRTLLRSWYAVPHAVEVVCTHCLAACGDVLARGDRSNDVGGASLSAAAIVDVDLRLVEATLGSPPSRFTLTAIEAAGISALEKLKIK